MPIFDKYAVLETRISGDLSSMSGDAHKRMATRQLMEDIKAGRVDKNLFTEEQLKQINAGSKTIDGFTWHHDGSVKGGMLDNVWELSSQSTEFKNDLDPHRSYHYFPKKLVPFSSDGDCICFDYRNDPME